ncbi:hypothetical protein CMO83_04220 [Candidatus Woesearchaeota archaeon]|nr:hypothetical protein [Candidatus Woesearchaeota archaeon]
MERTYVIPLRRQTLKTPYYRKAKKAVRTVKEFITRHMKSDNISVGRYLNLKIWEHGIKNPPNKVKIIATKDDKGKVFVELVDAPKEKPKVEEKKPAKKEEKPEEKKTEEKQDEEKKKIEKEELKEIRKELPRQQPQKMPAQQKQQQVQPTAPKSQ